MRTVSEKEPTPPHRWDRCSNCVYCSRTDGCCWCAEPLPDPCACTRADDFPESAWGHR